MGLTNGTNLTVTHRITQSLTDRQTDTQTHMQPYSFYSLFLENKVVMYNQTSFKASTSGVKPLKEYKLPDLQDGRTRHGCSSYNGHNGKVGRMGPEKCN